MAFHLEEQGILGGSIDNRVRGKTIITIHFTNKTSSLVTLQGNPCRDLAGSLWNFRYPFAEVEEDLGEQCFFIPPLCEGMVGRISYSERSKVPILPPEEHYDQLFDDERPDPPTAIAPVLELEWFTPKFGRVVVDCQSMKVELVEMSWAMTVEEAVEEERLVNARREEEERHGSESFEDFMEEMDLIEDFVGEDPEPHELEERCFLLVQHFVTVVADGSADLEEFHGDLLKLQEQVAGAFVHHNYEGKFDDVAETVTLLSQLLPFLDRASSNVPICAEQTKELLMDLREGIVALRDELAQSFRTD